MVAALAACLSVPALAQDDAEEAVSPGLFGTEILEGWDRRFSLGIDGQEGNTSELNFFTLLELNYADETDRWDIDISYDYGTEDNQNTDNEFMARVFKDWLIPDQKYFYWAAGEYEYDQFESYQQRISAFGGVGYELFKNEKHLVDGRLGLGAIQEIKPDDLRPEGLIGVEWTYDINDNQDLVASNYLFPNLEDLGKARNVTAVDWVIQMDAAENLSLRIGVKNEYDMNVDGGSRRNDLEYRIALVLDF
ncbi:MAG: DUF481 domain-containing protein [Phycisphaeraceae bacterium]